MKHSENPNSGVENPGYQQQAIIAQQPNNVGQQWMQVTQAPPPGCPPGLEYLAQIDQLLVKQQLEMLEIFTGWETNNKYKVKNSLGQDVYFAVEDNDCCTRMCCGPARPFNIQVFDNTNREVIHLQRPFRCCEPCIPSCQQELTVTSPTTGVVLGFVKQQCNFFYPRFEVCDADMKPLLLIHGPCCTCRCGDVEFKVLSLDGTTQVGQITKQWMGLLKETFTDADTFGVTFPIDLDVKVKACLLGALFLIDFMYFEHQNNNN